MSAARWRLRSTGSAAIWATREVSAAPPPPPPPTRTVSFPITDALGMSVANLSGLDYAVFNEARPHLFNAPAQKGINASINASNVVAITFPTSLAVGDPAWVAVNNGDGNPATLHRGFDGPVAVS